MHDFYRNMCPPPEVLPPPMMGGGGGGGGGGAAPRMKNQKGNPDICMSLISSRDAFVLTVLTQNKGHN